MRRNRQTGLLNSIEDMLHREFEKNNELLRVEFRDTMQQELEKSNGILRAEFKDALQLLRVEFKETMHQEFEKNNELLRTEFRDMMHQEFEKNNAQLKQYVDDKFEEVLFILRAEMNTLHQEIKELTARVDRIEQRIQNTEYAVYGREKEISRLPKTEARIGAVETVTQRHTSEICVLYKNIHLKR